MFTLFSHVPVENHLCGGEGRQRGADVALGGWRDLPAVVNSGRYCFLQRPDRTGNRLVPIVAEGRELGKVG